MKASKRAHWVRKNTMSDQPMKLQYLGDSKDSFKWDYHNFLVSQLGYSTMSIVPMMTPDDGSGQGQSTPSLFPASHDIIDFCQILRQNRSIEYLKTLPVRTGASYKVMFHNEGILFNDYNRSEYFSGFNSLEDQLVFLDPDIGIEPEGSCCKEHVAYKDLSHLLDQLSSESVISVFQHYRRKPFRKDFSEIRERIEKGYTAAIFWQSQIMFVAVSKSKRALEQVVSANENYSKSKPVQAIV